MRARIIFAAAQGASNSQIARDLNINVDTVRLWRDRWANWQPVDPEKSGQEAESLLQRFQDAPRPGAVPTFTAQQRAQMAALGGFAPAKTGRPIKKSDRQGDCRRTEGAWNHHTDFAPACRSPPQKGGFQPLYWLPSDIRSNKCIADGAIRFLTAPCFHRTDGDRVIAMNYSVLERISEVASTGDPPMASPVPTSSVCTSGSQMLTSMLSSGMASMVMLSGSRRFAARLAARLSVPDATAHCTG